MKKSLKFVGVLIFAFLGITMLFIIIFWHNDIPLPKLQAKYANKYSKFINIQGMPVHYREEGRGNEIIVLIHGTGASLHTWQGWVDGLKSNYRVISLDLPGYGLTGPNPAKDYSMGFYVHFLSDFFSRLGVNKCILAGNSLGGAIAWNYAVTYPKQVSKLVLVDAGGYPIQSKSVPIAFRIGAIPILNDLLKVVTPKFVIRKSLENVYVNQNKVSDSLVDRYFELSLREGNRQAFVDRMVSFKNKSLGFENTNKIPSLKMPVLVLWGENDGLIPLEVAQRFHHDLPHDTLVVLPHIGHTPMEEDAMATLAVLRQFLDKYE